MPTNGEGSFARTYGEALRAGAKTLNTTPTPMLDARTLLMAVSGASHADLVANEHAAIPAAESALFETLLQRRREGAPIAYLTGVQEFYGRDFRVGPGVLIPRPETEMLIDAALSVRPAPASILDLGTGSGCLLATVLAELPDAEGMAVERSEEAAAVAEKNFRRLGVCGRARLIHGDFAEAPEGTFDLILSNPPYIEAQATLPRSVAAFEPPEALFAGADGLDAYRRLAPLIAARLAPKGTALLEIGQGQGGAVAAIMAEAMLDRQIAVSPDLAGLDRMVSIAPAEQAPI